MTDTKGIFAPAGASSSEKAWDAIKDVATACGFDDTYDYFRALNNEKSNILKRLPGVTP